MIDLVFEFFSVIGVGAAPDTMAELIPYLIKVFVSVTLAGMVFAAVTEICKTFSAWRWVR